MKLLRAHLQLQLLSVLNAGYMPRMLWDRCRYKHHFLGPHAVLWQRSLRDSETKNCSGRGSLKKPFCLMNPNFTQLKALTNTCWLCGLLQQREFLLIQTIHQALGHVHAKSR